MQIKLEKKNSAIPHSLQSLPGRRDYQQSATVTIVDLGRFRRPRGFQQMGNLKWSSSHSNDDDKKRVQIVEQETMSGIQRAVEIMQPNHQHHGIGRRRQEANRLIKSSRIIGNRMHQYTADTEDFSGIEQTQAHIAH